MDGKIPVFTCLIVLVLAVHRISTQTYGGASCTIPQNVPGATTQCSGASNGMCALDTLITTGPISFTGKCICFQGYEGTNCATASPTSTTSTTSSTTSTTSTSQSTFSSVLGALALSGIAAYALFSASGSDGGSGLFGLS